MLTCTKAGTGYELALAKDGKTIRKATISISADGKKETVKATSFPANEQPYTITTTSERQSGGPGMSGVWKEAGLYRFARDRCTEDQGDGRQRFVPGDGHAHCDGVQDGWDADECSWFRDGLDQEGRCSHSPGDVQL
jgi:hypothetical protein